jgi:osmoprotectant transport system permease protein
MIAQHRLLQIVELTLRAPALWIAGVLLALLIWLPTSASFFHGLFPAVPHPVYARASFFELAFAHCVLVALSSAVAAIVGIATAIFVTRPSGRAFFPLANAIATIGQTIPPVAVLALSVPFLGYGAAPTLVALVLYAILPILENTITGIEAVPIAARDAATGMGFSPWQMLTRIEFPLAWPFILAGLRTSIIINIGTAAIGSSIGALSLGSPIIEGLSANNPAYVLQGALVAAILAMLVDQIFGSFTRVAQTTQTST